MHIACLEKYPILFRFLSEALEAKPYREKVTVERAPFSRAAYPLLLSDESYFPGRRELFGDLVLLPSRTRLGALPEKCRPLFCGMGREDEVTLSSIGEEKAMLCLQKEISLGKTVLVPQEVPIPFYRQYSLFKNAAVGFSVLLLDAVFGEE